MPKTKTVDMWDLAKEKYLSYAAEVNEDRAIGCCYDGLKPVQRRILWTMFKLGLDNKAKLIKAAKVSGTTMGDFHPHGSSAIYDAMVVLATKIPIPLIFGSGNWGTFLGDKAAADRYTECKLAKYSDIVFFDPFYNPVVKTVLNYNSDPNYREPVALNTMLPNALINSVGGIGVGVAIDMPLFTIKSVCKLITSVLKADGICTAKQCVKNLEFTNKLNGIPSISSEEAFILFKTGKGRVQFDTQYSVDVKKRTATLYERFADVNMVNAIEKTIADPRVKICSDVPNKKEKTFEIYIELKSSVHLDDVLETFKEIVQKNFRNNESYEINTTYRRTDDGDVAISDLAAANTPMMVNDWIKYRIQLEKDACMYWIDKTQKEIDYRLLLIKAVDQLEVIIKALRQRFNKDELRDYIAKHMKLTQDEAEVIISLRVYQLRRLEKDILKQEIEERKKTIAGYKARIKYPATYIIEQVASIQKKLGV
jgi:DNA gyrase/topoisomerase IV subunit A